jgi:hypothetical protein
MPRQRYGLRRLSFRLCASGFVVKGCHMAPKRLENVRNTAAVAIQHHRYSPSIAVAGHGGLESNQRIVQPLRHFLGAGANAQGLHRSLLSGVPF